MFQKRSTKNKEIHKYKSSHSQVVKSKIQVKMLLTFKQEKL